MEGKPLVIKEGMTKSAVHIDEAVEYGFDLLRGIAKYFVFIFLLDVAGIVFILGGLEIGENIGLVITATGLICFIAAGILGLALTIGVMYKVWVDILARSRQQKTTLEPLIVKNPP